MRQSLFIIPLFLMQIAFAQDLEYFDVPVFRDGSELKYPFAGGLNCPQFSQADLNNDGIEDIFIFDREGGFGLAFMSDGEGGYTYDRRFADRLPRLREWVLLRDFNNDGAPDILTFSLQTTSSIRVFKGRWEGDELHFDQMMWPDQGAQKQDVLHRYNKVGNNVVKSNLELYVFNVDYPAFYDVDGDGDLDLLTFEQGGFYLNYYKNYSVELGYGTDSLIYVLEDNCFGKFYESGISPELNLSDDPESCFVPGFTDYDPETRDLRHAGSTVTALEATGNGLVDILLGDITFKELVLAINGGTVDNAHMVDQDINFPSYDIPVAIEYFPAAYVIDVDLDGRKDLIVSPNQKDPLQNLDVAWYYKDISDNEAPLYELQEKRFIANDMLDFGTGANPTFFDYNGDGLLDLVVGMYDEFIDGDPGFHSRLILYENTGTHEEPAFELVDDNYLNFTEFLGGAGNFDFVPCFADIDGDGDKDLFVGEYGGILYFAENLAGPGNPAEFGPIEYGWQNILGEAFFAPFFFDLDGDGALDILFGDRRGEVRFLKNIGSPSEPVFNPDVNDPVNIRRLGDFTVRGPGSFAGMSAPQVVYHNGVKKLIVGSHNDGMSVYEVVEDDLESPFPKVVNDPISDLSLGVRIRPSFADITNDGFLEMIVGNFRGGVTLFKTPYSLDPTLSNTGPEMVHDRALQWTLNPNPASSFIQINITDTQFDYGGIYDILIMDTMGRQVKSHKSASRSIELPVDQLTPGVYFMTISQNGFMSTKKFIKQ